jgi:hypothetical protein
MVILLIGTFFIPLKEGLEDDYLSLAIHAIKSAQREYAHKDGRMTDTQKFALQDALSYANYIKHTTNVS